MNCFRYFQRSIQDIELPDRFTFPFYYEPHPLVLIAADELQAYLKTKLEWAPYFGWEKGSQCTGIGKMFGVLVVRNRDKKIGYLAAFSGKLANSNHHEGFVPPVFDMLKQGDFYLKGEQELNQLNRKIEAMERQPEFQAARTEVERTKEEKALGIKSYKNRLKEDQIKRRINRANLEPILNSEAYHFFSKALDRQRILLENGLKKLKKDLQTQVEAAEENLNQYTKILEALKSQRRFKSGSLQQRLFKSYQFLDKNKSSRSLFDIFTGTIPPSGAGECAAPKLLNYAFSHEMELLAMGEFWWGVSPKSEVRRHQQFYPACHSKCRPILGYMLKGIKTDPDPILDEDVSQKATDLIYEDEYLLAVHKPHGLLAVPGKQIQDSVSWRMKQAYPQYPELTVVHRLDRSTSGIMLIAKTLQVYKDLQKQFVKKQVKKRYVAVLDGDLKEEAGTIDLPLRVDLEDRPRQLVCYDHGKAARTHWKKVIQKDGKTRVHFFPITGRTHQLRVHAAHAMGLNVPIMGDDLYGEKADRMYLHAEEIEFIHPVTKQPKRLLYPADF